MRIARFLFAVLLSLVASIALALTEVAVGVTKQVTPLGTTAPSNSAWTWEIWFNGASVANDTAPSSWTVTLSAGKLNVFAPVTAILGDGYEVRYKVSAGVFLSEQLNVIIRMPKGAARTFTTSETNAPTNPAYTWQILKNNVDVAHSPGALNGWSLFPGTPAKFTMIVPVAAPLGADYEMRYKNELTNSAEFDVVVSRVDVSETAMPTWAEAYQATERFDSGGKGPSSANSVNLASGVFTHAPEPDLEVKNPVGPDASFSRICKTSMALQGVNAQELAMGWRHNYDESIISLSAGDWNSNVRLLHANGSYEEFDPVYVGPNPPNNPTTFNGPQGTPYLLTGVPSLTTGIWSELNLRFKDLSKYTFTLYGSTYQLTKITNRMGRFITINRDTSGRLLSVVNDASLTLLTFTLDGNGRVTQIQDKDSRIVKLTYVLFGSITVLQKVSQVGPVGSTPPSRWEYAYKSVNGKALLLNTSSPSAVTNGSTLALEPMQLDSDSGRVQVFTDAVGNRKFFTYNEDNTTRVNVYDAGFGPPDVTLSFTAKYSGVSGLSTGYVDATLIATNIIYADPTNVSLPTQVTNRNGQSVFFTYDQFGNLLTETDLRGVVTTFTYDYNPATNPLGLPIEVKTGLKQSTKVHYYSTGLVDYVESPKPGFQGGSQYVISEKNLYTSLGNLVSRKVLDMSGLQVETTYTYETIERLGMPASATEPGEAGVPRTTFFTYDTKGRMTAKKNALSSSATDTTYEEKYGYNDADQLTETEFPKVVTSKPNGGKTLLFYGGTGLDPYRYQVKDQDGVVIRTRDVIRGTESAVEKPQGDAVPFNPRKNGLDQVKQALDGNLNSTSIVRNSRGFVERITYPAGSDLNMLSFDNEGNILTQQIGTSGTFLRYVRASDDSRITRIEYNSPFTRATDYQHDVYGRTTQMVDQSGTTTYTYDDLDNVMSVNHQYAGAVARMVSYTYNDDGSRSSMVTPFGSYSYTYNGAGEVKTIATPWGQTFTYNYDKVGQLLKQLTSKIDTTVAYNARGWQTQLKYFGSTISPSPMFVAQFTSGSTDFDGIGNVLNYSATGYQNGLAKPFSGEADMTYSPTDEVSTYVRTFSETIYGNDVTFSWIKDSNGNGVNVRGIPQPRGSINEITLSSWFNDTFKQVTAAPAVTVGEVIRNNGRSAFGFAYDEDYNVTQVTKDSLVAMTSLWRGDGLRAWKDDPGVNPKLYYLYDGDQPIAEFKSDGTANSQYAYGPLGLVQRNGPSVIYSYGYDPHGHLAFRFQHSGAGGNDVSQVAVYDPKGMLISEINPFSGNATTPFDAIGPFAQQGAWADEQLKSPTKTGLGLVGKRYYDPTSNTYMTRDQRFGNAYSDEDDGSGVIMLFQAMSILPLVGMPFDVAMSAYDASQGDYGWAAVGAFGAAADVVGIGVIADSMKAGRAASNVAGELVGSYSDVRKALRGTGLQANHLNQHAAYGSAIPRSRGVSNAMAGNAITDIGSPHYKFHETLESFWGQYRAGGSLEGLLPTNAQYGQAVRRSLASSGKSQLQSLRLANAAKRNRLSYGLSQKASVPRIPGRLNQRKP